MTTRSHIQNTAFDQSLESGAALSKPQRKRPFNRNNLWELVPAVLGVLWLLFSIYPIIYMLFTSLRPQADLYTDTPWSFPSSPTLENYLNVLVNGFLTYFVNTLFVTVISVFIILVVSLLAAYAISQVRKLFTRQFLAELPVMAGYGKCWGNDQVR